MNKTFPSNRKTGNQLWEAPAFWEWKMQTVMTKIPTVNHASPAPMPQFSMRRGKPTVFSAPAALSKLASAPLKPVCLPSQR